MKSYKPKVKGDLDKIKVAIDMLANAKRPIIYSGGGIINSGKEASHLLREFARMTGFPVTSTLMGLGAFPAANPQWLGMLGMHGTYEANWTMHDCDVMLCIGARFDDRITGRLDAFSPGSRKIHVDIDPSSINKNVKVDLGDRRRLRACAGRHDPAVARGSRCSRTSRRSPSGGSRSTSGARAIASPTGSRTQTIKPQYAIQRLYELTKDRDVYITTEVGQHQMWAAQFFKFEEPNRWMTSGGLGTMGYGLPASVGVQLAHPKSLVIDIAGEASVLMTMQEMSTAAQYRLPIKIFILNNQYMGMVRQWQELLHGGRYSESYTAALPDFVKLAEAYRGVGIRCDKPGDLDHAIKEMINVDKPVHLRLRGRSDGKLLPDDPVGQGAQRDAARRRCGRHREGDRRKRQGAGVMSNETPASASHYPAAPVKEKSERHTLSVLVDNEPGVLARVIGLFSGRGYNIDSLTVSETEHEKHLSRITIVTTGTPMVIEQIRHQLERLVQIHRVVDLTEAAIPGDRARARDGEGARQGREPGRGAAPCRRLPRARDRRRHRELHLRDHRREREDRELHQPDAAARPGRGLAHRRGRDLPRPGGDVGMARGRLLAVIESKWFANEITARPLFDLLCDARHERGDYMYERFVSKASLEDVIKFAIKKRVSYIYIGSHCHKGKLYCPNGE